MGKWTERDLKIGCIYFSEVNCVHGSRFKHYQREAREIPPQLHSSPALSLLATTVSSFSCVLPEFYDTDILHKCDHTANIALPLIFPLNLSW